MLNTNLPHKLQHIVRSELEIGEPIVWSGTPVRKFFTPASTGSFLFGIPWTAFAIFWTVAAGAGTISLSGGLSFFSLFPLFGVPFVLIGFGMLLAPVFEYIRSGKTVYVITDRRALSFIGGKSLEIKSFKPENLGKIFRRQKKNGTGDIVFQQKQTRDSDGDLHTEEIGFQRVQEVKRVEGLLKALAEKR